MLYLVKYMNYMQSFVSTKCTKKYLTALPFFSLQTLSVDAQETQPRPLVDCAQLIHFAKEAQLNGDYQLAAQYYQEITECWRGSFWARRSAEELILITF